MDWSFETAVRTLWQEVRGETEDGRRAVAHVIVNRLKAKTYGDTLASVVLAPYQFSGWNANDPNRISVTKIKDDDPVLVDLRNILSDVVTGTSKDPTGGATFYYPQSIPKPPPWAAKMQPCGKFGNHLFFKPKV